MRFAAISVALVVSTMAAMTLKLGASVVDVAGGFNSHRIEISEWTLQGTILQPTGYEPAALTIELRVRYIRLISGSHRRACSTSRP